jgi:hypothetical protein
MTAAGEALAGEVEARSQEDEGRLVELVGDAVRGAEVLLDEHPDVGKGVGGVVGVVDCLVAAELVTRGVEGRGDFVVDALLPVSNTGTAARGAEVGWSWEIERTEGGAVCDNCAR